VLAGFTVRYVEKGEKEQRASKKNVSRGKKTRAQAEKAGYSNTKGARSPGHLAREKIPKMRQEYADSVGSDASAHSIRHRRLNKLKETRHHGTSPGEQRVIDPRGDSTKWESLWRGLSGDASAHSCKQGEKEKAGSRLRKAQKTNRQLGTRVQVEERSSRNIGG